MRLWYNPPSQAPKDDDFHLSWAEIFTHWPALALDLHDTYGIDTETDVLDTRTWPWLEDRIFDLINRPSRIRTALQIPDTLTT